MKIRYRIIVYFTVIGLLLSVWLATPRWFRPVVYSIPSGKVAAYLARKHHYKLLFVGDSRTFTDIQPRVVSPLIGRASYNMASFGLWMPVQYLEFRDAFPQIPSDTVVVWSLSHRNFLPIGDRWWIPGQYRFGLTDVAQYIFDGYPVQRILREYEESPYSPIDLAVSARKRLMKSLDRIVWKSSDQVPYSKISAIPRAPATARYRLVAQTAASPNKTNSAEVAAIVDALGRDKSVNMINRLINDGVVNSIETTRTDGGYDRIVVDRAYFRERQSHLWPVYSDNNVAPCVVQANDVYMRTFHRILDLISKYHLKVIVNYIEDAPGSWSSPSERRCAKQFIVEKIVPILSQRGIEFVAPDLYPAIDFSNDYYFDQSHLVTEGARIYSELLGAEIKKVLERRGW